MPRQIVVVAATTAWQQLARAACLMAAVLTLLHGVLPLKHKEMGSSADASWQISSEDVMVWYFSLI